MNTINPGAAGGTLQLALELQQHLQTQVSQMGAANPMLAPGQQLAAMDAGGVAANLNGASSGAVKNLDTYA